MLPSSNLCQFQFACSTPEGAILVLPNGSSRTDLIASFRSHLLAHARKHALSWLEWVYGGLEFASSIYLITGTNKCENWCLASYSNIPAELGVSLSFTPTVTPSDRPSGIVRYAAQSSGNITRRTFRPNEHSGNQSVFIRGYKIQACRTLRERLQGAVKITDMMSQKDKNPMYLDAVPGATHARSTARKTLLLNRILSKFTDFSRRGSRNQPTDPLDEDILQVESFPGSPEVKDAFP